MITTSVEAFPGGSGTANLDGRPSLDAEVHAHIQSVETAKLSHSLENGDESSPRASKKRRLGPESDTLQSELIDDRSDGQILAALTQDVEQPGDNHAIQIAPENSAGAKLNSEPSPDMAAMISDIMDHSERIEEQAALGSQQMPGPDSQTLKGFVCLKANTHLKIQSLPILDNLSTQILSLLAKSSYQDITSFVSEPDSENGQAYATMRSLFDHTKRVYSAKKPFLNPTDLGLTEPSQVDVIRKANLASFVSSIFGSQDIGFSELNEHFLDVFAPDGGRLLKVQGALYLELKTQAFISSMHNTERSKPELLHELFPDDLEHRLLRRRLNNHQLVPSEADFVKRALSRREILLNDINNEETINSLPEKYHWENFLRDLSSYISKNFNAISNQQTKKFAKPRQPSNSSSESQDLPRDTLQSQFSVASQAPQVPVDKNMHGDLVARAARAAQIALQGQLRRSQQQQQQPKQGQQPQPFHQAQQQQPPRETLQTQHQVVAQPQNFQPETNSRQAGQQGNLQGYDSARSTTQLPVHQAAPQQQSQPNSTPYQPPPAQLTFQQSPYQANFQPPARQNTQNSNHGYMPGIPHYSQSQPTQVLYERARMAASAKTTPSTRKCGLPSQRRPWTTEEENALMAGLDRVKGPHWSQILAMFGPGGTISEALKDRNQVQLKDKARNLKLFFLKSGIEVPYYLKFVTGELKTRAPAQAAKREARERQKRQGEEDKAHVEGIKGMMALAGAQPQQGSSGTAHDSVSASPGLTPDANTQHLLDQDAEQKLIQSLGQEVHGESFGQSQSQELPIDLGMHLDQ